MKRNLNSQTEWCRKAQSTMAIGLTLVVSIVYYWGLRPAANELALVSERTQMRRNQLFAGRIRAATLPAIQQETDGLRKRLQQFDKQVPHHQDLPELISDVTAISRHAELTKLAWRPTTVVHQQEEVTSVPIEFTFTGDYLGVFRFLGQVENLQRLTRLRKLDVQARDSLDGQVDVQLTMNIYFSEE